ncbi:hypothetical protein Q4561_00710 [Alteromonas sp. 1_MG-2023]|uniref:hypothetical protein n=1 Tax=Alteromonas sp. 1_MG-2023 TaxID=3062669 RepID=UPI0026E36B06|nr:hypothetical protein [Alteromonas sp. 1_MG-2023]MDO6565566.1 hypothetical protein [Alteromonas sp. 1_MG-2023]
MIANRSWWLLAALLGITSTCVSSEDDMQAADDKRNTDAEYHTQNLHKMHFGEVVYSLYVDEPLTVLGRMAVAEQKGVSDTHGQTMSLMKGGVQLGYGMPQSAQHNLSSQAQSLELSNRPLAWYWLARLNFSHQRYQQGIEAYDALEASLASADIDVDELLTPAQWYELNYEAAQGAMSLDHTNNTDISRYLHPIPKGHITRHYLRYNRAVEAYQQGNTLEANHILAALESDLTQSATSSINDSGWLSWLSWWQDRVDTTIKNSEIQALLNQVLLSNGQVLLDLGQKEAALFAFDRINTQSLARQNTLNKSPDNPYGDNGQNLLRDEALLHYGWGLAQTENLPLALGVWDFLSKQHTNLFTLQATHALAYGYAQQGGEVQAYDTLQLLTNKLEGAIGELDNLTHQVTEPGYWQAVSLGANELSGELSSERDEQISERDKQSSDREEENSTHGNKSTDKAHWEALWPASQQDLLAEIIADNSSSLGQQDKLSSLVSLYGVAQTLGEQLSDVTIYENLLDERDSTHANRVQNVQPAELAQKLETLQQVYSDLQSNIDKAETTAEQSDDEWLSVLLTFATADQKAWYERIARAQANLSMLAGKRTMRPSYQARLHRAKGTLIWQLAEQFQREHWQSKKDLGNVHKKLIEAGLSQQRLDSLLNAPSVTTLQRNELASIQGRIKHHLHTTNTLITTIEAALTEKSLFAIAQRKAYLSQQHAQSRLAMLQLRDFNLNSSPSTPADKTSKVENTTKAAQGAQNEG